MLYHYVVFLEIFFWFNQLYLAKIHYFTYNFLKLTFCNFFLGQNLTTKLVVTLKNYNLIQYFFLLEVNFDKFTIGLYLILISFILAKF